MTATWVFVLVLAVAAGAIGAAWHLRRRQRLAAPSKEAPRSPPPPRPTLNPVFVLRGDDVATLEEHDARDVADELRPFLADIARQHGAREVTLWRHQADGGLAIIAWSGDGRAPDAASWGSAAERALVDWSAREQLVGFEQRDNDPRVAISPIRFASGEPAGAVVLAAAERFDTPRGELREWLPRHATQLGRLVNLLSAKNEVARQNRFMRAQLRIARDLQKAHDPAALESALCAYAVEVTGSEFALLLRWDSNDRTGSVVACSLLTPTALRDGEVTAGSLAGAAMAEGTIAFWEDARFLSDRGGLLRDDDGGIVAGSLAVLPLLRGPQVIGALLIGATRVGVLRALEIRNASLLALLAVNALEAAWELAESSRRSRTDALTGLWNRRHFDDQLERVLNETDRFGGASTLVIVDIDFFKKVNDTYGHDAGDVVLMRVSDVLRQGVRTVDIVARLGGEELALILPQTALEGAVELADRLRQSIEAMVVPHGGVTIKVTVSMGVAAYRAGEDVRGQLFKRADEKLYAAKRGGRNRVEA